MGLEPVTVPEMPKMTPNQEGPAPADAPKATQNGGQGTEAAVAAQAGSVK